jgi:hypothetical protein
VLVMMVELHFVSDCVVGKLGGCGWSGRWAMGDGRWAMGDGRWAMGDGRWAMGRDLVSRLWKGKMCDFRVAVDCIANCHFH